MSGTARRLRRDAVGRRDLDTDEHELRRIQHAQRTPVDEKLPDLLHEHKLAIDQRDQQHGNKVPEGLWTNRDITPTLAPPSDLTGLAGRLPLRGASGSEGQTPQA